jgi:hypothetical protein
MGLYMPDATVLYFLGLFLSAGFHWFWGLFRKTGAKKCDPFRDLAVRELGLGLIPNAVRF